MPGAGRHLHRQPRLSRRSIRSSTSSPSRPKVISIAEPGHTDALEFDDGKLMLGKHESLNEVNWDNLVGPRRPDKLTELMRRRAADRHGQLDDAAAHEPHLGASCSTRSSPTSSGTTRTLFIDLADPEKRTHEDILDALTLLTRFQDQVDVILGLNLKESLEIADVLGLPGPSDPEAAIEDNAAAIREKLSLDCVVIHPRRGAAAATGDRTPPGSPGRSSSSPRSAPAPATTSTPASASAACSAWASKRASAPAWRPAATTSATPPAPASRARRLRRRITPTAVNAGTSGRARGSMLFEK